MFQSIQEGVARDVSFVSCEVMCRAVAKLAKLGVALPQVSERRQDELQHKDSSIGKLYRKAN